MAKIHQGGLAQLVERVLSMHEVWGSIPQSSMAYSSFSLPRAPSLCDVVSGLLTLTQPAYEFSRIFDSTVYMLQIRTKNRNHPPIISDVHTTGGVGINSRV